MYSSIMLFLLSGVFLSLRLGTGGGTSFPRPLSPAEEQQAVTDWVERRDLTARNTLVEHNLRLVAHIIKKYYAQTADQEDLLSIGTIGLIKGVSTYRPDRNVRLSTYVSRCIENEILMHFRRQKKSAGDVSLSNGVEGEDAGDGLSLLDTLAEERDMLEEISLAELRQQARDSVATVLDAREAEIIRLRYGLDREKPLTQREVAAHCGISRSYVSRIEKKALEKLRHALDG